jgi:hypothetical protein
MGTDSSQELTTLKQQLDDLVTTHGWSTMGYYFDDSPFEGIHLIKENNIWKLYWKAPGVFFVEKRFINLIDAYQEMKKAVVEMKQREIPQSFEVDESLPPVDATANESPESETDEIEADSDGDLTDGIFSITAILMFLLPWLLVGIPLFLAIRYAILELLR